MSCMVNVFFFTCIYIYHMLHLYANEVIQCLRFIERRICSDFIVWHLIQQQKVQWNYEWRNYIHSI